MSAKETVNRILSRFFHPVCDAADAPQQTDEQLDAFLKERGVQMQPGSDGNMTFSFSFKYNPRKYDSLIVPKSDDQKKQDEAETSDETDASYNPLQDNGDAPTDKSSAPNSPSQDAAITLDDGLPTTSSAAHQCALSFEDCRARNRYTCRYHGQQLIKGDILRLLEQQGITHAQVDITPQGHAGTLGAKVTCLNNPAEIRRAKRAIQAFLSMPGVGDSLEADYNRQNRAVETFFDVDNLNAEASSETNAHAEENPQREQPTEEHEEETHSEQPAETAEAETEQSHERPGPAEQPHPSEASSTSSAPADTSVGGETIQQPNNQLTQQDIDSSVDFLYNVFSTSNHPLSREEVLHYIEEGLQGNSNRYNLNSYEFFLNPDDPVLQAIQEAYNRRHNQNRQQSDTPTQPTQSEVQETSQTPQTETQQESLPQSPSTQPAPSIPSLAASSVGESQSSTPSASSSSQPTLTPPWNPTAPLPEGVASNIANEIQRATQRKNQLFAQAGNDTNSDAYKAAKRFSSYVKSLREIGADQATSPQDLQNRIANWVRAKHDESSQVRRRDGTVVTARGYDPETGRMSTQYKRAKDAAVFAARQLGLNSTFNDQTGEVAFSYDGNTTAPTLSFETPEAFAANHAALQAANLPSAQTPSVAAPADATAANSAATAAATPTPTEPANQQTSQPYFTIPTNRPATGTQLTDRQRSRISNSLVEHTRNRFMSNRMANLLRRIARAASNR